jgi:glycosyltransferase involved in cell wall biosynthesis
MKIATLSNASVVHTHRWVSTFRSRGHDVRLWSLEPGPPELGALPLPRFPLPGLLRYPLAVPALRAALARFAPDVVDAHFVPNYGLMGALGGHRPLVVSAWGSDLLVKGLGDPLQAARARFVLSRATAVVADGENLAEAARRLGGGERVHTIPWGIDVQRFRSGGAREPGLLLSTRMHEEVYDLPTVIRGAAELLAEDPALRLAIAGSGRLTPRLERLASRLIPGDRVRFLGRLDTPALADWLARAEVFLSASHSDSTSQSLLEAMASGAIPVVSDLEGNRAWVRDGDGARCFAPGDAAGLARAVRAVRSDPAWAEAARRRNRERIERDGDVARNMARIEQLFETLRGARAAR